jgi:S1-C subfamily serine protease
LHQHGTLIQTDFRLHAGCSGGALIDLKGELIGLTSVMAAVAGSDTAGGYAIPIDDGMKRVIEVLKRGEEVEYGFLGVVLHTPTPKGEMRGIPIKDTVTASPAAAQGLQANDVIVSINGMPIKEYHDLFLAISITLAGNEARLEIIRGLGTPPRTVRVTLDKAYVPGTVIASRKPPAPRGLRVDPLGVLMQKYPSAQPVGITQGVVVREVVSGSAAAKVSLKIDDIITHVKGQPVRSPAEFYKRMQSLTGPIELTLGNAQQVILN